MVVTAAAPPDRGRLIDISPQSEGKIANALRQPRLGVLGIEMDAPGVDKLAHFVLEHIDQVNVPWLEQRSIPAYLPVKIDSKPILQDQVSAWGSKAKDSPRPMSLSAYQSQSPALSNVLHRTKGIRTGTRLR